MLIQCCHKNYTVFVTAATVQFPPCQYFAASGIVVASWQTRMKLNRKSIYLLAAELTKLKARAKALGVFTNERELLACPRCGLVEDVTCDGLLITYMSSAVRFAMSPCEPPRCQHSS